MAGKTVSLRRFARPLALEPPAPYRVRRGGLQPVAGASDALLGTPAGTPLLIVVWRPNLDGTPAFHILPVRAGTPNREAGLLPVQGLRTRPGEHVVHVQRAPLATSAADEQRY